MRLQIMARQNCVCRRNVWRLIWTVAAFFSLAGIRSLAWAQDGAAGNPNKPMEPFRVIGNIYWVGLTDHGAFLLTTPRGDILLDTTSPKTAHFVRESIEKLGFQMHDIKIIVGLHAHGDHTGGTAYFKELTGAKVMVSKPDAPVMADGGRSDFRENGTEQFKPVKPDRTVKDGDQIRLGNLTLVAHLTPGHSKGCTTWTTTVEDGGKKYNVVFVCGVDAVERVPLVNNAKYPQIAEDFAKAFAVLKSLPCDVFLYTRADTIKLEQKRKRLEQGEKPNPFIDPKGCQDYISERERMYLKLLAKGRSVQ